MQSSKKTLLIGSSIVFLGAIVVLQQIQLFKSHERLSLARQNIGEQVRMAVENERLRRKADRDNRNSQAGAPALTTLPLQAKPDTVGSNEDVEFDHLLAQAQRAFDTSDMSLFSTLIRQIGRLPAEDLLTLLEKQKSPPLPGELKRMLDETVLTMLFEEDAAFVIEYAMMQNLDAQAKRWMIEWATQNPEEAIQWFNQWANSNPNENLGRLLEGIVEVVTASDLEWSKALIASLDGDFALAAIKGAGATMAKSGIHTDPQNFIAMTKDLDNWSDQTQALAHFGIISMEHSGFEDAENYLMQLNASLEADKWNEVMMESMGRNIFDNTEFKLDWVTEHSDETYLSDNIASLVKKLSISEDQRNMELAENWLESFGDSEWRDQGIESLTLSLMSRENQSSQRAFWWAYQIKNDERRHKVMQEVYHTWHASDPNSAENELRSLGISASDFGYTGELVKHFQ